MNELIGKERKAEILAKKISEMQYGDVITHTEIEMLIQEKRGNPKYNATISKARKILLDKYKKSIENIRGDGYRLIQPDDFIHSSLNHYRKGFKSIQRGYKVLENAPVDDMTSDGKVTYRLVKDRSLVLLASMKGASAELKTLSRRNPFDPALVGRK